MNPTIIASVRKFFYSDRGAIRLRRRVRLHLEARFVLDHEQAESLILALLDGRMLIESTVWYYDAKAQEIVAEPGLALAQEAITRQPAA